MGEDSGGQRGFGQVHGAEIAEAVDAQLTQAHKVLQCTAAALRLDDLKRGHVDARVALQLQNLKALQAADFPRNIHNVVVGEVDAAHKGAVADAAMHGSDFVAAGTEHTQLFQCRHDGRHLSELVEVENEGLQALNRIQKVGR